MRNAADGECKAAPGQFVPRVDHSKCEGKSACVDACPYDVFEVRRIEDADFATLGLLGKLKSLAHGRKTAYAVHADACRACGRCVEVCPEKAIRLTRDRTEGPPRAREP
jgi:NAD-dependent dihydropyrimidine dehydrogenase PreA subunit